MRKWEWSWSILEWAKFYAEWNNYFCAVHSDNFLNELPKRRHIFKPMKYEHKDVCKSIDSADTNLSSIGFAE